MKEKFKLKNGNILYIIQDESPMNPRTEWDNLCTMVCWHSRYNLGDNHITGKDARNKFEPPFENSLSMFCDIAGMHHPDDLSQEELGDEEAYKALIRKTAEEKAIILPLRLLDHSGITMSIGRGAHWSDPGGWDSGQVGWIFVTRETLKKEGLSDKTDEEIVKYLEGEVETYDQYLTGDVYGFQLKKIVKFEKKNLETGEVEIIEEEEDIDSCWGFYGHNFEENGLYDHAGIKKEDILEEKIV